MPTTKATIPDCKTGRKNLSWMLRQADKVDRREGMTAYSKYRIMMERYAEQYDQPIELVTAAFCALSPNNDYVGNLRSLTSVLEGLAAGVPHDRITISTYNHCRDRAIDYLTGADQFVSKKRGLKILSFYHNILNPEGTKHVTVDGHMAAAFCGDPKLVMKDVIPGPRDYRRIEQAIKDLAKRHGMIPNQMQATLWFTRKRLYRIKYVPVPDMFAAPDDIWQTVMPLELLTAYPIRPIVKGDAA